MKIIKKVNINITTYFFIFLLLYSGYKYMLFSLYIVFFIHEFGHVFFCYLFKIKISSIDIFLYGGIIKLNKMYNNQIYQDFLISFGGVLFQILFEFINLFFIKSSLISFYNRKFIFFNILPIIPFDGSKTLFCFISKCIPYFYALKASFLLSFLCTVYMIIYMFFLGKLNILFILFVLYYTFIEIKHFNYVLNQFYLERYLHDFSNKKHKYYDFANVHYIKRENYCFFFDNYYISERKLLAKKFDNSSHI